MDEEHVSTKISKPREEITEENHLLKLRLTPDQVPIVYSPKYNVTFWGLQKLHPFDSEKWGRVHRYLTGDGVLSASCRSLEPEEAKESDLRVVHPQAYLDKLKSSWYVAYVTEVLPVAFFPNALVQRKVLKPLRYQTGGSILAGRLALEQGWAINVGGGFHHCRAEQGGGFCAYADISLLIRFLLDTGRIRTAMIVDLDAHQGNGHEHDFMGDSQVYILDVYNSSIYPRDHAAKKAIRRKVEIRPYTENEEYLEKVSSHLKGALNEFLPDLVVYNAGTDVLEGDPLGLLSLSPEGVVARDECVWSEVRGRGVPVVMLTSGGYQRTTARVIADSIKNLKAKGLINK